MRIFAYSIDSNNEINCLTKIVAKLSTLSDLASKTSYQFLKKKIARLIFMHKVTQECARLALDISANKGLLNIKALKNKLIENKV